MLEPLTYPRLPYRHFRQLLSLHAKTSRSHDCVLHVHTLENIERFTYAEFNARVHQTANLLYDDLQLRRGDCFAVAADHPVDVLLITFAAWIIGACAFIIDPHRDNEQLAQQLNQADVKVIFLAESLRKKLNLTTTSITAIQVGGVSTQSGIPLYYELVKNLPTTFLGDESHAKSDDDAVFNSNASPSLHDIALIRFTKDGVMQSLTQSQLLEGAMMGAFAQGLTATQRQICTYPVYEFRGFTAALQAMITGGSIVFVQDIGADAFWNLIVQEHIHVAVIHEDMLNRLYVHAEAQFKMGRSIFAERISRRELTHFRHFTCISDLSKDSGVNPLIINQFETLFGMKILSGVSAFASGGVWAMMPMDLSWDEHRNLVQRNDALCLGIPFANQGVEFRPSNPATSYSEIWIQQKHDGLWWNTHLSGYEARDPLNRQILYAMVSG